MVNPAADASLSRFVFAWVTGRAHTPVSSKEIREAKWWGDSRVSVALTPAAGESAGADVN